LQAVLASLHLHPYQSEIERVSIMRMLDFNGVCSDALSMLRQHQEAVIAIAGLLIFIPRWASGFFIPPPDLKGLNTPDAVFAEMGRHFMEYWPINLPLSFISFFGGLAVVCILLRNDMAKVGDALKFAAKIFPAYFVVSLVTTIFSALGALAFLIGMLYIIGRMMPSGPIIVAEPDRGIGGSIMRSWELTRGLGWKAALLFTIVFLIGWISLLVVSLLVGTLCRLIAGPEGVPLIETCAVAIASTLLALFMLSLEAALYRHLQAQ
jgi:hypothetical protein